MVSAERPAGAVSQIMDGGWQVRSSAAVFQPVAPVRKADTGQFGWMLAVDGLFERQRSGRALRNSKYQKKTVLVTNNSDVEVSALKVEVLVLIGWT